MVDFIRMGLLELCRSRVERELQNVKFLSTVGFEPGTSRLLSEHATTELRRLMSTDWIKVHLVFTCAIFRNLPVAFGRCSKIIFRELHFVNSLLSANFLIGKQQNQSLTKVAVLPVIRSGFYEDRQKFTLCQSECPTQFFSNTKKIFLAS